MWSGELTMTIDVDLGRKAKKKIHAKVWTFDISTFSY